MYISIKPKSKANVDSDLSGSLFNSKTLTAFNTEGSGKYLKFYEDKNKEWYFFAHYTFYYTFDGNQIFLQYIDFLFYKLPPYISLETLLPPLLTSLHHAIGDFEIIDHFTDCVYDVNPDNLESAATKIGLSIESGYKERDTTFDMLSLDKSSEEILKHFESFTPSFQNMAIADYICAAYNQQNVDRQKVKDLLTHCLENINKSKVEYKDFLLFKLMIGGKVAFSPLFHLLPKNFYTSKYSNYLGDLKNVSDEISQILLLEFISGCAFNMIDESLPFSEALLENSIEANGIFSAEMAYVVTKAKTGDDKEALKIYKEENEKLILLRNKFEKFDLKSNAILNFKKSLLLNTKNLSLIDRYYLNKINLGRFKKAEIYTLLASMFLGLVISSITIITFYTKFKNLSNSEVLFMYDDWVTGTLQVVLGINLLFIPAIVFFITQRLLLLYRQTVEWKLNQRSITPSYILNIIFALLISFSSPVIILVLLIISSTFPDQAMFYAFKDSDIYLGRELYNADKIERVIIKGDSNSSDELYYIAELKFKDDNYPKKLHLRGDKTEVCNQILILENYVKQSEDAQFEIDKEIVNSENILKCRLKNNADKIEQQN